MNQMLGCQARPIIIIRHYRVLYRRAEQAVDEHVRFVRALQIVAVGLVGIFHEDDAIDRAAEQRFNGSLLLIGIPVGVDDQAEEAMLI